MWGRQIGLGRTAGLTITFLYKHGPGTGVRAKTAAADVAGLGISWGLTTIGTHFSKDLPMHILSSCPKPQPPIYPLEPAVAQLVPQAVEQP